MTPFALWPLLFSMNVATGWSFDARSHAPTTPPRTAAAGLVLFGGPGDEDGVAVVPAGDGGWFIVSNTTSYGAGATDIWVVKTRSDLSREWDHTFGTSAEDKAWNATSDGHGGLLIGGHTGTSDPASGDLVFIRIDGRGNVLWHRTYELPGKQGRGYAQRVGEDGYVLSGWSTPPGGSTDFLLLRTDTAGEILWQRTYGGDGQNGANAVLALTDGGFAVYGEGRWSGGDEYSGWQGILVRTGPDGRELWHRDFGGTGPEEGYGLARAHDGGFLVGGFSRSDGRPGAYALKCDSAGREQWWRRYALPMVLFQIEPEGDGYRIVGPGGMARIDEQGEPLWSRAYPIIQNIRHMAARPEGGYLILGSPTTGGSGGRDVALLPTDEHGEPVPPAPQSQRGLQCAGGA